MTMKSVSCPHCGSTAKVDAHTVHDVKERRQHNIFRAGNAEEITCGGCGDGFVAYVSQ